MPCSGQPQYRGQNIGARLNKEFLGFFIEVGVNCRGALVLYTHIGLRGRTDHMERSVGQVESPKTTGPLAGWKGLDEKRRGVGENKKVV